MSINRVKAVNDAGEAGAHPRDGRVRGDVKDCITSVCV
jgi:hypothetical protein